MMLALTIATLFLGMVVTESRTARKALARSDSRLRAILTAAPDSIVTVDADEKVISSNRACTDMFGYSEQGLIGMQVGTILPQFKSLATGPDSGLTQGVRKDGTRFPVEVTLGNGDDGT